jgi:hypothetical protein
MRALPLSAIGCLLVLTGCDPDTAVFVDPSIGSPSATIQGGTLGASLTGSFTLELHLGPRASGASDVTVGAFDLLSADQTTTLVGPLPTVTDPASPIRVDVDSTVELAVTFDTGADPIPSDVGDAICAAGNVVVSGTIQDSLQNAPTPVASEAFAVLGCP